MECCSHRRSRRRDRATRSRPRLPVLGPRRRRDGETRAVEHAAARSQSCAEYVRIGGSLSSNAESQVGRAIPGDGRIPLLVQDERHDDAVRIEHLTLLGHMRGKMSPPFHSAHLPRRPRNSSRPTRRPRETETRARPLRPSRNGIENAPSRESRAPETSPTPGRCGSPSTRPGSRPLPRPPSGTSGRGEPRWKWVIRWDSRRRRAARLDAGRPAADGRGRPSGEGVRSIRRKPESSSFRPPAAIRASLKTPPGRDRAA